MAPSIASNQQGHGTLVNSQGLHAKGVATHNVNQTLAVEVLEEVPLALAGRRVDAGFAVVPEVRPLSGAG